MATPVQGQLARAIRQHSLRSYGRRAQRFDFIYKSGIAQTITAEIARKFLPVP